MVYIFLLLSFISVPLYFTFQKIIETKQFENAWNMERFLVNGKYLIIKNAKLYDNLDHQIITMNILAREPLSRTDLAVFKEKVQGNFSKKIIIRADVNYIL